MEDAAATARQRLARWIEDSREVFALLPELLDGVQKASAKTEHAEREAERLRRELMGCARSWPTRGTRRRAAAPSTASSRSSSRSSSGSTRS